MNSNNIFFKLRLLVSIWLVNLVVGHPPKMSSWRLLTSWLSKEELELSLSTTVQELIPSLVQVGFFFVFFSLWKRYCLNVMVLKSCSSVDVFIAFYTCNNFFSIKYKVVNICYSLRYNRVLDISSTGFDAWLFEGIINHVLTEISKSCFRPKCSKYR